MCRSMHLYPFLLILPVISITEEWGGDDEERRKKGRKKANSLHKGRENERKPWKEEEEKERKRGTEGWR